MNNNNSSLNINKANFINFRNENIVDFYEFAPKVLTHFLLRNLDVEHMVLCIRVERRILRDHGEQLRR